MEIRRDLRLALLEANMGQRAYMLKLVRGQPLLAPTDDIFFFVGMVDVDYDCPSLSTTPSDPMFDAIAWQKRGTLENVVIWA